MPSRNPVATSLPAPAARTHASQRKGQAQGDSGNAHAFSIGWPVGFVSRTSDRADKCFVGKLGDEAKRSHAPSAAAQATHPYKRGPFVPAGVRIHSGTRAWQIWQLIVKRGPMLTNDIAARLDIHASAVANVARRLVKQNALKVRVLAGKGRQFEYSLAGAVVVEVAA